MGIGPMTLADALFRGELVAATLCVLFLIWLYARFIGPLYWFLTTYFALALLMVFVYAMVYALIGRGAGIPYLFWHEDFSSRVWASMGVTLLLSVVGVIAYYLDPYPWLTDRRMAAWLSPDETIKAQLDARWRRRMGREWPSPGTRSRRALARAPRPGSEIPAPRVRWWSYLGFAANVVLDPVVVLPVQSWIEPTRANQVRLQRFLRTCRTPCLVPLLMPALFPHVFSWVPTVAPTGGFWTSPPSLDVRESLLGYLLSVSAWLLGIVLGVFITKLLIKASEIFYFLLPRESQVSAEPNAEGQVPRDPRCPLAKTHACPGEGCPRGLLRRGQEERWRDPIVRGVQVSVVVLVIALAALYAVADARVAARFAPILLFAVAASLAGLAIVGLPRTEAWAGAERPISCRAGRLRHISVLVFVGVFLTVFVLMGFPDLLELRWVVTPAIAICAALSIFTMALAVVDSMRRWVRIPIVLILLVWLGYANNDPFKNRFENMDYEPAGRVDLRSRTDEVYFTQGRGGTSDPLVSASDPLVPDHLALENWTRRMTEAGGGQKPKLVVVAVSGGAMRSAYWGAAVLARLEREIAGFGRHVRIITGASGGMLGAAYYVTYRRDVALGDAVEPSSNRGVSATDWTREIPVNSLQRLARYIALKEIWRSLWPYPLKTDRGVVLERDWAKLRYPLANLTGLERDGKIPSIIVAPMMIEDGRQLLFSNLDLGRGRDGGLMRTVMTQGREVSYDAGTDVMDTSLPAIEFFRMFPECRERFLISTAVRMNASSPYVSPAVNLPSDPLRRVVDASYFDNFGIELVLAWLEQNHEALTRLTSGVLLVQIRDSSGVRERLDIDDTPATLREKAARGYEFLTSPLDGFLKAQSTVSFFRNDTDVEWLNVLFAKNRTSAQPGNFYSTVIFENSADVRLQPEDFWGELTDLETKGQVAGGVRDVSMTWYLTRAEKAAIDQAIPSDPAERTGWRAPAKRLEMLRQLAGQVFKTLPAAELAKLSPAQREELRKKGLLCHEPGPSRDIRFKRLEQLRNYERIQALKRWWRDGAEH